MVIITLYKLDSLTDDISVIDEYTYILRFQRFNIIIGQFFFDNTTSSYYRHIDFLIPGRLLYANVSFKRDCPTETQKYSIDYTYGSTDSGLDVSIINKVSGAGYLGQYMYIILN